MRPPEATTPDPTSLTLARSLGHKDAHKRAEAVQSLREHGEDGLNALLAVWQEERRSEERRGWVAFGTLIVACLLGFILVHFYPQFAIAALGILAVGAFGILCFVLATRREQNVVEALAGYDDPCVLQPLAESLRRIPNNDPRRAAILDALRRALQEQPDHQIAFPGTGEILRWLPNRAHRRVRWFWLWLTWTVLSIGVFLPLHLYFGFPYHYGSLLFVMPLLYTFIASSKPSILQEDVIYERPQTQPLWRFLVGMALFVCLGGLVDHALTGRPSWAGLVIATCTLPASVCLANLLAKFAFVEPSEPSAAPQMPSP